MARIDRSPGDLFYSIINYIGLSIILIIVLYPLIYIASSSISSVEAVISGKVWLYPVGLNFAAYQAIFEYPGLWTSYGNTFIYTFGGIAVSVAITILAAYPLSRKTFSARNFYMFLFAFTMIFYGGLIPFYMQVRNLGLLNSRWSMILPTAMSIWNVIITRTYYQQTISEELHEAAQLDGCSDFKFLLLIVIPLSGAITAVNALFYGVAKWNSYFDALLFLTDRAKMPMQILLRRILISNTFDGNIDSGNQGSAVMSEQGRQAYRQLIKYALIIFSSLPILSLYPFLQKYFVRGIMIGSLKG